ncbi:MerR family transcriptional regulator [Streptodolium elevatio]|uniref:MerR family transcriptional regulator n=1 Tax=Streptodolium elevatio TaxID=3157996 RepID=A0ABV3DR04_9ACTN
MKDAQLAIGPAAERFGLATHVLRHWEDEGLLSPPRDGGGRRRYGNEDLFRIAAILRAKEAGFDLVSIRAMLADTDVRRRRHALEAQRTALRRRIAEAQAALDLVDCALGCDHDDMATCPHFRRFLAERVGGDALANKSQSQSQGESKSESASDDNAARRVTG